MTQSNFEGLSNTLANIPEKISRLTNGLSDNEAHWKPSLSEFSVVENVCHLRDIEIEGYSVRIKRILLEDEPFLEDLNGAQLAEERVYNDQDLKSALDAFAQARHANVDTIRKLSSEQARRTGTYEKTGVISLEKVIEMIREHDDAHIVELTNLRARIEVTFLWTRERIAQAKN